MKSSLIQNEINNKIYSFNLQMEKLLTSRKKQDEEPISVGDISP